MISIFVAKLDFGVDNDQLKALFEQHGTVNKATVALDRETRKSRGFGFVEMRDREEGLAAIAALDNSEVNGRKIAVKEAEDRGGGKKPGFTPRSNAPRPNKSTDASDERPARRSEGSFSAPRPAPSDMDSMPSDDYSKSDFRKKDKEPKKKEKSKNHKMEAYKKSGKNNIFIDDEDEDEPLNLFDYGDEDEDFDSSYLINNDDEDEDWDEEDDV